MHIHIPNRHQENLLKLEDYGAVKLFDFQCPNDFDTRSIWKIIDRDKFEEGRKKKESEFIFFLANEEMVKGFEKFKI